MKIKNAKRIISIMLAFVLTLVFAISIMHIVEGEKRKDINNVRAGYYYEINSGDESNLRSYLSSSTSSSDEFIICEDLDFSGITWTPVGTMAAPFKGQLIGNSENGGIVTIKNITINITTTQTNSRSYMLSPSGTAVFAYRFDGFFGVVQGATIKNIRFENVTYNVTNYLEFYDKQIYEIYFGTICGRALGSTIIENCEVVNLTVKALEGNQSCNYSIAALVGKSAAIGSIRYNTTEYSTYNDAYSKKNPLSASGTTLTTIKNCVIRGDVNVDIEGRGDCKKSYAHNVNYYHITHAGSLYVENVLNIANENVTITSLSGSLKINGKINEHTAAGYAEVYNECISKNADDIEAWIDNCGTYAVRNLIDCTEEETVFFYDSGCYYDSNNDVKYSASNSSKMPVFITDCGVEIDYYGMYISDCVEYGFTLYSNGAKTSTHEGFSDSTFDLINNAINEGLLADGDSYGYDDYIRVVPPCIPVEIQSKSTIKCGDLVITANCKDKWDYYIPSESYLIYYGSDGCGWCAPEPLINNVFVPPEDNYTNYYSFANDIEKESYLVQFTSPQGEESFAPVTYQEFYKYSGSYGSGLTSNITMPSNYTIHYDTDISISKTVNNDGSSVLTYEWHKNSSPNYYYIYKITYNIPARYEILTSAGTIKVTQAQTITPQLRMKGFIVEITSSKNLASNISKWEEVPYGTNLAFELINPRYETGSGLNIGYPNLTSSTKKLNYSTPIGYTMVGLTIGDVTYTNVGHLSIVEDLNIIIEIRDIYTITMNNADFSGSHPSEDTSPAVKSGNNTLKVIEGENLTCSRNGQNLTYSSSTATANYSTTYEAIDGYVVYTTETQVGNIQPTSSTSITPKYYFYACRVIVNNTNTTAVEMKDNGVVKDSVVFNVDYGTTILFTVSQANGIFTYTYKFTKNGSEIKTITYTTKGTKYAMGTVGWENDNRIWTTGIDSIKFSGDSYTMEDQADVPPANLDDVQLIISPTFGLKSYNVELG